MQKLVWFLAPFLMFSTFAYADFTKSTRFGIHYLMDNTIFPENHCDDCVANSRPFFYHWNINHPVYLQPGTFHCWFKREDKEVMR